MIQLIDATIRAGAFCLHQISLQVSQGEYGVLMGPTGNGKTTILEAICGLRRVSQGKVLVNNVDVTSWAPCDRGIGYVPQDLALFPTLTVREHLEFALRLHRNSHPRIAEQAGQVAEQLRISHLLDRSVHGLSGGESQRVALGRAIAFRPSVLLLDEPLSALDESTRGDMHETLRMLKTTTGVTTLHVTHSSEEAAALADCRFVLTEGKIRAMDVAQADRGG